MRKYYKTQETTDQKIQQKQKEDIREYFDVDNLGYDLKELLIIILAGIILIFVLDLLVKIGKKMKI
jgi:uridine kinase